MLPKGLSMQIHTLITIPMLCDELNHGVETHVVLAPQTTATYQMAPHNVHNQSMSSDYLIGCSSANPQWIRCLPCIIHILQCTQLGVLMAVVMTVQRANEHTFSTSLATKRCSSWRPSWLKQNNLSHAINIVYPVGYYRGRQWLDMQ